MNNIKFSILIPSIPSRVDKFLIPLLNKINSQMEDRKDVEVITLLDNKKRSIGLKRDALVQLAQGEYLAFVDDDDNISDNYILSICSTIENNPTVDVIVFKQIASINNKSFTVDFGLEYENEEVGIDEHGVYRNIKRKPFHVCVWKRLLAQKYRFPDCSYGEDWAWASQLVLESKSQHRIDDILHYYVYDDAITEAPVKDSTQ